MSTARSSADATDTTPLLHASVSDQILRSRRLIRRPPSLRGAARFLRRASSRRIMREPSMRVRETAAEQLEERQSDWAYSKPIVILDIVWNLAFVVVAMTVLVMSRDETPSTPLRLWIIGYGLQCVLHMVCVCVEYKRRRRLVSSGALERSGGWGSGHLSSSSGSDEGDPIDYRVEVRNRVEDETR